MKTFIHLEMLERLASLAIRSESHVRLTTIDSGICSTVVIARWMKEMAVEENWLWGPLFSLLMIDISWGVDRVRFDLTGLHLASVATIYPIAAEAVRQILRPTRRCQTGSGRIQRCARMARCGVRPIQLPLPEEKD